MIQDLIGNKLFRKGDVIYLSLVSEGYSRKLGIIDEESKNLITTRVYSKHLYRNANSFGFNSEFLRNANIIENVKLLTDKDEIFIIPIKFILEEGSYLHFKKKGFERQIFINIEKIKQFKNEKV